VSGELGFTFPQSEISYYRKRRCVCVFDLRTATLEQIEDALGKFYFLDPFSSLGKGDPVFLLLNDACFEKLIPWTEAQKEGYSSMWIPYVEAGYPGAVPWNSIARVLLVEVRNRRRVPKPLPAVLDDPAVQIAIQKAHEAHLAMADTARLKKTTTQPVSQNPKNPPSRGNN
jgi:hypothetical protein